MDHIVYSNMVYNETARSYNCADPNTDISGLGVIIAFTLAAILTTGAAIHAAILDGMTNEEHAVLPRCITICLSKDRTLESKRRLKFHRELLDRLMIALADQQLLTGFALLLSAFILAGKHVNDLSNDHDAISWAQWDLVVLLSCLSSSSHLACVITLKHHFARYRASAWLRISLIIVFAILVAVSVDLSLRVFKPFWDLYDRILRYSAQRIKRGITYKVFYYFFYYAVPPFFVLYPLWISIMQLSEHIQNEVHNFLCLKWLPAKVKRCLRWTRFENWSREHNEKCTGRWCIVRTTKDAVRFLVFSNMTGAFCIQILFTALCLFFVLMQKFANPKLDEYGDEYCSLNTAEENEWGFGQMLALFMLLQPFVSAMGSYFGEFFSPATPSVSDSPTNEPELKEKERQEAENRACGKSERTTSTSYERVPGCEPLLSDPPSLLPLQVPPPYLGRDTDFPTAAHLPLLRGGGDDLRSVLPRHETV